MRIVLAREGDSLVVEPSPHPPGMYKVGRGSTIYEAMGNFLIAYQEELGLEIHVDDSAWADEMLRRNIELAKR